MNRIQIAFSFADAASAAAFLSKCPALPAGAAPAPAAASPAPAAAAQPAASGLTQEQMQGKLKTLMEKKGKEVVVAIFAKLSAKKLSDIPAAKYGELDAAIAAALVEENLF